VKDRVRRHAHGIWHLFVMGGSANHFVAVMFFVA
jgi:hemolysin III